MPRVLAIQLERNHSMKSWGITIALGVLTLGAGVACASGPSKYEQCLQAADGDSREVDVCRQEERERQRLAEEKRRQRNESTYPSGGSGRRGGSY